MVCETYWKIGGYEREDNLSYISTLPEHMRGPRFNAMLSRLLRESQLWNSEDGSIELVLGVRLGGASYLLLPDKQIKALLPHISPRTGVHGAAASEFASLSPIWFRTLEELEAKISLYKAPKSKSKRQKRSEGVDITIANPFDYFNTESLSRARFEQNRVLYNIFLQKIDPEKFSLPERHLDKHVRIVSLAANYALAEDKGLVLDIAWQHILLDMASRDGYRVEELQYIRILDHRSMQKGGAPAPFDGNVQRLSKDDVRTRLQDILAYEQDRPIVLLCWNYTTDLKPILEKGFKIDTSLWEEGVDALLGFDLLRRTRRPPEPIPPSSTSSRSTDPRRRETQRRSSRSLSPSQRRALSGHVKGQSDRSHSASSSPLAPVYVIDLLTAFETLRNCRYYFMPEVARQLGLDMTSGWCAGHECRMLSKFWQSMFSGDAIDERRTSLIGESALLSEEPVAEASTSSQPISFFDALDAETMPIMPPVPFKNPYEGLEDDDDD